MSEQIVITRKEQLTPKHKAEHEPFEYLKYEVTKRGDGQCYVCLYEIPPKRAGYPYHYHMANTEVFYITAGAGIIETPDGAKPIKAGDVIVCPPGAGGAHKITNTSDSEALTYLDCDTANTPDVCFYPHSGKIGVMGSMFFERDSEVEYYKGE